MCTVTFIPQEGNDYILTSNRDEFTQRSPQRLSLQEVNHTQLLFPRDTMAGGTWIVTSNNDQTICILNGAFSNHKRTPPYRRSRGLMALDFFSFKNSNEFAHNYLFTNIEPFTMVICEGKELYELRWDGNKVHYKALNTNLPHIWSSWTLYDEIAQQKRLSWFKGWLGKNEILSLDTIMDFHQYAGEGDPFIDINMKRSDSFKTVSITNIIRQDEQITMKYHDLIRSKVLKETIG